MTIDVNELRGRLRLFADQAADRARELRERGDIGEAQFQSGRQAAFVTALTHITLAEQEAARERDENMVDEALGEEAARLGLIGKPRIHNAHRALDERERGEAVDLEAVQRLEEIARNTAVDYDPRTDWPERYKEGPI